LFELPFNRVGLVEWLDFLPPNNVIDKVSSSEKIVLRNLWGYRPVAFGLLSIVSSYGSLPFRDSITLSLVDGTPVNYRVSGYSDIIDIVKSYSLYSPSAYRPAYKLVDGYIWSVGVIHYLNTLTSPIRVGILDLEYRGTCLLPVDPLGLGGDWWLVPWDMDMEVGEAGGEVVEKYLSIVRDLEGDIIIPLLIYENEFLKGEIIHVDGSRIRREGLIYENEDFLIDLTGSYRGSKFTIQFKRFRYFPNPTGNRLYINVGVSRFPPPSSHLVAEYYRDNMLIMSSPSLDGWIGLPILR